MSVESHLTELVRRHQAIEQAIMAEESHPAADELKLHELKRKKLSIKDEIERLKQPIGTKLGIRAVYDSAKYSFVNKDRPNLARALREVFAGRESPTFAALFLSITGNLGFLGVLFDRRRENLKRVRRPSPFLAHIRIGIVARFAGGLRRGKASQRPNRRATDQRGGIAEARPRRRNEVGIAGIADGDQHIA